MRKRICLAVVVGLMIVCAAAVLWMQKSTAGHYTITEPYEYTLIRGSEEWFEMNDRERVGAYSVPDEVISAMTTRALLETVIANPFFVDLSVIEFETIGAQAVYDVNIDGLEELLNREDFEQILLEYSTDDFSAFKALGEENAEKRMQLVQHRVELLKRIWVFLDAANE